MLKFVRLRNDGPDIIIDNELFEKVVKVHKFEDENMTLYLKKCDNGLYYFYLTQDYDSEEHEKGYHWSSRVGVVNKYFNTELIQVSVDYSSYMYSMDINDLKRILPFYYKVIKEEKWEGEIYYSVVPKEINELTSKEFIEVFKGTSVLEVRSPEDTTLPDDVMKVYKEYIKREDEKRYEDIRRNR